MRGLLGETAESALERFGTAEVDRALGEDRWMVFEGAGWSLRLRARPERFGAHAVVRSWTVSFDRGFESLADALAALGLPEIGTGADPGSLRLPLTDARGRVHSLTADERAGRVRSITAFDEPPEWLGSGTP